MTKQLDGFQKAFDILRLRSEDALRRKQSELNYEDRLKLTGIIVAARCILSENELHKFFKFTATWNFPDAYMRNIYDYRDIMNDDKSNKIKNDNFGDEFE